jgi:hypothetical protein
MIKIIQIKIDPQPSLSVGGFWPVEMGERVAMAHAHNPAFSPSGQKEWDLPYGLLGSKVQHNGNDCQVVDYDAVKKDGVWYWEVKLKLKGSKMIELHEIIDEFAEFVRNDDYGTLTITIDNANARVQYDTQGQTTYEVCGLDDADTPVNDDVRRMLAILLRRLTTGVKLA